MLPRFYFILDVGLCRRLDIEPCELARQVFKAGVRLLQLRDKSGIKVTMALQLASLAKEYNAVFVLNDCLEYVVKTGADGVHLGQSDLPASAARFVLGSEKTIGISARSPVEAIMAQKQGADYIGVGPMFATTTKTDAHSPLKPGLVKEIIASVSIPVFLIGGISFGNMVELAQLDYYGVAVSSFITLSKDVKAQVKHFNEYLKKKVSL